MAVCEVLYPYLKLYSPPDSSQIEDKPPPKKIPRECYSSEHAINLYRIGAWEKCIGGLINVGFNCYINSSIQCLLYTPGFQIYLTNLSKSIYQKNLEGPFFLRALGDLINEMQKSKSVCPTYFINNAQFLNESFRGPVQQDAHEFLLKLINRLELEGQNQRSKESITSQYFSGMLSISTVCHQCGKRQSTREMFHDIPITIGQYDNLQEYVSEYTTKSEREIEFECPKCGCVCSATQITTPSKMPLIITVTMLRFTNYLRKVDDFLEYPEILRVGSRGTAYQLYAMIVHEGRLINHGHYISYFCDETKTWYRADDIIVYKVKPEQVLKLCPYVLFYKRVNV